MTSGGVDIADQLSTNHDVSKATCRWTYYFYGFPILLELILQLYTGKIMTVNWYKEKYLEKPNYRLGNTIGK